MDDPNNRNRMAIKEIPASPSADATVDSTCASSVATSSQHANNEASVPQTVPTSRDLMRRQVLQLGLASSGAAGALILSLVPVQILMSFTMVFLLWVSFLYRLFQFLQAECNSALQGRGIGDILPASMYDSLVNRSFHEVMTDGAFIRENQHFMLYFIPGLSVEQVNNFVNQLVPRHRRALHRPGIGNFLGDGFMRLLIGDQGLAERQNRPRANVPQRFEILPSTNDNHNNDNDNDNEESSFEERQDRTTSARLVPRRLELEVITEDTASVLGDEDDEEDDCSQDSEDLSLEEAVVFDAVTSGAMNLFLTVFNYSRRTTAGFFLQTSGRALQAALGLGVLTLGTGFAGIWAGYWTRENLRLPTQLSSHTRSIILSSTLASGATASLFMLSGLAGGSNPKPEAKNFKRGSNSQNPKPKKT